MTLDIRKLNAQIATPDGGAMGRARARWNSIAKPIGSLGLLEDAVTRIAGLVGSERVDIKKRAVIVMCADNGVVSEGVTQTGQEITALVAGNIARGDASVCRMARVAGAEVTAVDIGMVKRAPGVLDYHIKNGTNNIAQGPAMTPQEAVRAIAVGMELVREYRDKGYRIIATGEMGIGNTTTSSAMAAVLLNRPVCEVTGRGAGLTNEGLSRKTEAISRAIAVNRPDGNDALDVLQKVGGLDIAGMTGLFLGGALYRVPVLIDGFISAVAALTAKRLCENSTACMTAAHASAEPATQSVLAALGMRPLICADMRLGEGTGAVAALPLLDMALSVYNEMDTFSQIGMEAYTAPGENE